MSSSLYCLALAGEAAALFDLVGVDVTALAAPAALVGLAGEGVSAMAAPAALFGLAGEGGGPLASCFSLP